MNKRAFTLTELLITLSVIGVLAVVTINSLNNAEINDKKIKLISQDFYSMIDQAYLKITNVDKVKITSTSTTAASLMNNFLNYINGTTMDCSNFTLGTLPNGSNLSKNNAVCAKTQNGGSFALAVNTSCNSSITVLEFKEDNKTSRTVTNVCGYILYKTPKSDGNFGDDLFSIPLGKKGLKS